MHALTKFLHLTFAFFAFFFVQSICASTSQFTLSYRDDPSSTIVIGWSGDVGTLYYDVVDHGANYLLYPNSKLVDRSSNIHGINRRFVRLNGLLANTEYYFVVKDAQNMISSRYYFKTLSNDSETPLSFISGGDTRDGFKLLGVYIEDCPSGDCREMRRKGNKMVAKLRPDFVAFNGDFVMNQITSNTNQEWNNWLDEWELTYSSDGRVYPMTFTQGNHEDNADIYNLFDVPVEEYYALNFHDRLLRLYLLNSEMNACSSTAQLDWLTNDLQNHTSSNADPYWKFVNYHVPTFSMGNGYGLAPEQMECWVPLFESFGVRLVMESHGHLTKWSYPCKANATLSDFELSDDGIVYIGEGQWGAPHRNLDFTGANQKPYIRDQDVFDNFFWVRVTPNQTTVQCIPFANEENLQESQDNALGKELSLEVPVWSPSNGNQIVLTNASTDIQEVNHEFISIFPNVANDFLKIRSSSILKKVELINSLGKSVYSKQGLTSYEELIHTKSLPRGVYYIIAQTENTRVYKEKIILH